MLPFVRGVPNPRLGFEVHKGSDGLVEGLTCSSCFGEDFANKNNSEIGGGGHAELRWGRGRGRGRSEEEEREVERDELVSWEGWEGGEGELRIEGSRKIVSVSLRERGDQIDQGEITRWTNLQDETRLLPEQRFPEIPFDDHRLETSYRLRWGMSR